MMMASVINLKDILYALTGQTNPKLDIPVSKAVIDSRQASEGSLFIAFPGEHVDGHDYVQAAFDNGAKIALVEKDLPEGLNVIDLRAEYFQPHFLTKSRHRCVCGWRTPWLPYIRSQSIGAKNTRYVLSGSPEVSEKHPPRNSPQSCSHKNLRCSKTRETGTM